MHDHTKQQILEASWIRDAESLTPYDHYVDAFRYSIIAQTEYRKRLKWHQRLCKFLNRKIRIKIWLD